MPQNSILFCLPYAGGSARSMSNITFRLNNSVEVRALELPGRGERRHEPLCTDLNVVVDEFYNLILDTAIHSKKRILLWGHSMGAVLALLLAFRLENNKDCSFDGLIVSAMTSPVRKNKADRKLHLLPEQEFFHYFEKLIPINKSTLNDRMKNIMFEKMQSIVRADVEVLENNDIDNWHSFVIHAPIYVLIGKQDEIMPHREEYDAWKFHTHAHVKYYLVNGGHFFILDYPVQTANILLKIVNESYVVYLQKNNSSKQR